MKGPVPEELREALESGLRRPPTQNPKLALRPFGDVDDHVVRFYLYLDVLEELSFAAEYREHQLALAVLTGGFGLEGETGFIEVTGFTGLEYVVSEDEIYATIRPVMDAWMRTPNAEEEAIVGLFVGGTDTLGALSEEMARVHLSLFNVPFQPVVIVDPEHRKLGVYARPPRSRFANVPFTVVSVAQAEDSVREVGEVHPAHELDEVGHVDEAAPPAPLDEGSSAEKGDTIDGISQET